MMVLADIPVVLIEDDVALAGATVQALELEGATVTHFGRASAALDAIDREFFGVVVSDIRLPGIDGIDFFERLRAIDDSIPIILISGHGDIDLAVGAMRQGAFDFLAKPFSSERLAVSIAQAAANRALVLENRALRAAVDKSRAIPGTSAASQRLRALVAALSATDVDVAIEGACGTGKSHTAKLLHELGPRRSRPFVVIDAGIVHHPDAELLLFGRDPGAGLSHTGLIERARGGTLVLDEIESVVGPVRARLASLVENRTIFPLGAERARKLDLRIVAIHSPETPFGSRAILHRSGPVQLTIPTLKERREDVGELFGLFLARHERELGIERDDLGAGTQDHLRSHDWPGNLRELESYAKSLLLGVGTRADAAPGELAAPDLRLLVARFEKGVIEDALRKAEGNIARVEEQLSVPKKTLYDKIARYGIKPKTFR